MWCGVLVRFISPPLHLSIPLSNASWSLQDPPILCLFSLLSQYPWPPWALNSPTCTIGGWGCWGEVDGCSGWSKPERSPGKIFSDVSVCWGDLNSILNQETRAEERSKGVIVVVSIQGVRAAPSLIPLMREGSSPRLLSPVKDPLCGLHGDNPWKPLAFKRGRKSVRCEKSKDLYEQREVYWGWQKHQKQQSGL